MNKVVLFHIFFLLFHLIFMLKCYNILSIFCPKRKTVDTDFTKWFKEKIQL